MRSRTIKFSSLLAVLALVTSACVVNSTSSTTTADGVPRGTDGDRGPRLVLASNALQTFDACDDFLDYVISRAVEMVGPYGLEDPIYGPMPLRFRDDG